MTGLEVLVGVLTVLVIGDIAVTAALIGRMRRSATGFPPAGGPVPGRRVGRFSVPDTEGWPLRDRDLTGEPTIWGFFSTSSPACMLEVPDFVARTALLAEQGVAVLAVVLLDPRADQDHPLVRALAGHCRLVLEREPAPVRKAMGVVSSPAYGVVIHGTVVEGGADLAACVKAAQAPIHQ